jgi:hypothetical protein
MVGGAIGAEWAEVDEEAKADCAGCMVEAAGSKEEGWNAKRL